MISEVAEVPDNTTVIVMVNRLRGTYQRRGGPVEKWPDGHLVFDTNALAWSPVEVA